MKGYKKFGGEEIEDLGQYCLDYIKDHPDVILRIGTDSRQLRNQTLYGTVVVFQNPSKGCHVVFKRTLVDKQKDLFSRLWLEIEMTKELGEYLLEETKDCNLNSSIEVDLDVNPSKKYKSNIVYQASVGYLISYGFHVNVKDQAYAASYCADLICK